MSSVLNQICDVKRTHVAKQKSQISRRDLESLIEGQISPPSFAGSITANPPGLIAEVKKASPSKGILRPDFDPVQIAQDYQRSGAACLSVLTDEPYFKGCDQYLKDIAAAVSIPLLRKDFMVDVYQVYEARAFGAACILVIMAAVDDSLALDLTQTAHALGMDVLVEIHDEHELERALTLPAKLIGVNSRDLKTLKVDVGIFDRIYARLPKDKIKIAESGIVTYADIQRLKSKGYQGFLVGEGLIVQDDIALAVRKLLQHP